MNTNGYHVKLQKQFQQSRCPRAESYCTTGQFSDLGPKGYLRHCGPTALTNLIRTVRKMEQQPLTESEDTTFSRLAALGSQCGFYMNADLFQRFGGTSDLLSGLYIRAALRMYHTHASVAGRHLLTERSVKKALDRGSILYVEFHNHPKYGNHHVICYSGMKLVYGKKQRNAGFYLKCADGWADRPRYLSLISVPCGSFIEIQLQHEQ